MRALRPTGPMPTSRGGGRAGWATVAWEQRWATCGGRAGPTTASARARLGYKTEGEAGPLGLGLAEAEEGAGPSGQKRREKDFPFSNPFLFSFLKLNSNIIVNKFK